MRLPRVAVDSGARRLLIARALCRRNAIECAMNAGSVVVVPEGPELARQIQTIPIECLIEALAADGADQSFHEWMRCWHVRDRLDLLDIQYT